jgi:hypothetical protein
MTHIPYAPVGLPAGCFGAGFKRFVGTPDCIERSYRLAPVLIGPSTDVPEQQAEA